MPNLCPSFMSANEFFHQEIQERKDRKTLSEFHPEHLDYMDFAERYADYVVSYEKYMAARPYLATIGALENQIKEASDIQESRFL